MTIERDLVGALMSHELSEEEFLLRFPHAITQPGVLPKLLSTAFSNRDAEEVEDLLFLVARFKLLNDSYVSVLSGLLAADWHFKHEDIARHLQSLRAPSSIEALYAASTRKHPYLEYDNGRALARKCIWALGDIGTPEARDKLKLLAELPDRDVALLAQQRLDRLKE